MGHSFCKNTRTRGPASLQILTRFCGRGSVMGASITVRAILGRGATAQILPETDL